MTGDMNATAQARQLSPKVGAVSVRWLDGSPRYLKSGAAAERIRAELHKVLDRASPAPQPQGPIDIEIAVVNQNLLADRAPNICAAWNQALRAEGLDPDRFPAPAFSRRGAWLTWQAPDALTAFVSIAFAASHLEAADNWDLVSRGYTAYKTDDQAGAIQAYEEALRVNPYDTATRCRLAAAHLDEAESALGSIDAARNAAKLVLTLLDAAGRHAKARDLLRRADIDTSP